MNSTYHIFAQRNDRAPVRCYIVVAESADQAKQKGMQYGHVRLVNKVNGVAAKQVQRVA